jgi:acyl-CoA thioester hydrolase
MQTAAPFEVRGLQVKKEWIDYNGHMNMAFYNVMFDEGVDQAFELVGLGPDYVKAQNASYFTLEAHINYVREVHLDMPLQVTLQILDFDSKRVHFFMEMYHEKEGWLAATSEQLCMHVDMAAKRSSPFPEDVLAKITAMHNAHKELPRAPQIGRVIGIKHK